MGRTGMTNGRLREQETKHAEHGAERRIDRLVRVGAPLMLALSSLSILAVMLRVHEVPPSVLVPIAGLVAAAALYHWGQRSDGDR